MTEPFDPVEPPVEPAAAPATDVERAIADFDEREQARVARPRPVYTPFSLADVDRRIWILVGVGAFFVGVSLGGPPWQASFWITLGLVALVSAPFVVGAIFFWQRARQ